MKLKLFTFILSLAVLTSCEDLFQEDTTAPDGSTPYILMQAPFENSSYTAGQTVRIKSEITDKDKIKQLEVLVTKTDGNGQEVWGFTSYPKKSPVILDTAFTAVSLPAGKYTLTVNTVDGRSNIATKVTSFSIK